MREQEGRAFIDKINSPHFILMLTTMHDNLAQCLEDIQTLHSTEIVLFFNNSTIFHFERLLPLRRRVSSLQQHRMFVHQKIAIAFTPEFNLEDSRDRIEKVLEENSESLSAFKTLEMEMANYCRIFFLRKDVGNVVDIEKSCERKCCAF